MGHQRRRPGLREDIGFDRAGLYALRNQPGREGYWNFDGGSGGHHRLYLATNEF
jgi:hypothetical protein